MFRTRQVLELDWSNNRDSDTQEATWEVCLQVDDCHMMRSLNSMTFHRMSYLNQSLVFAGSCAELEC